MNKKLFLIFHGRFPSEKAASLFAAKNTEAFADKGLEVTLLVSKRKNIAKEDPFVFYNIRNNFNIIYIQSLDLFNYISKMMAFLISMFTSSVSSFFYVMKKSQPKDIIYSNEILSLFFISYFRPNCFYEMHDFPESKLWIFGYFLKKVKWILIHNQWKLEEIKKKFPKLDQSKFLYEPNAVDIDAFNLNISTEEARKRVELPLNKKIAIYTGHLYSWKGVDTLAQAAEYLEDDFLIVFVGGTDKDIEEFKRKYGNSRKIMIVGHKPHKDMPVWQKAADVLVLPNTAKEKISAFYTSPMKLFEYMASKKPIVASDIPSIREVLNNKNSILVEADNPEELSKAIVESFDQPSNVVEQAFRDVSNHTWIKRAERIINFISL